MKSSLLIWIAFLGSFYNAFAQVVNDNQSQTYAVIIGISDYQNEDIPDLRFADKDAAAFTEYLKSPAGGSLTDEQLKMLLNEKATLAQIAAALEWLVEVSKEGDNVIIYFSGHGDVENTTMFQLGYLLTWDTPAQTYVAGGFPLQYLQAIVSTLALQNKAQVALITDACRAGKLAGNAISGTQLTNANLSKQFANEVKILSCQPDEFSLEGEQWGGGRGVFSYHLLDGLYGLADKDKDLTVNLFEIGRYLEDKVSNETSPHNQFPMVVGSKNTRMAWVDEAYLAQLKEQRSRETPVLASVESKGFEEMILVDLDSVWQKKYRQFTAAVADGHLLDSPTEEPAAYDLYLELQQVVELKKLHGTMQRNLAAALQDEAQQAINAYLEANPTELAKRYKAETDYKRYPRYLRKAAEILGEQNFYYPYVLAKLYYFEGLQLRLDTDNNVENASYEKAIERQTKALEFQEYAPFVLNELGVLHTRLFLSDKAIDYYKKAIEMAPQWGLPYINYCIELFYSGQYEESIKMGEKAAERLSDFPELYGFLAWINANNWQWRDKQSWQRKGTELQSNWSFERDEMSTAAQNKERYQKSIALLEKAIKMDSTYEVGFKSLGMIHTFSREHEKAIEYQLKLIDLDPENDDYYNRLGLCYNFAGSSYFELSEQAYLKAIALDSTRQSHYNNLGVLYKSMGKWEQTIEVCTKANNLEPSWHSYANIADAYALFQNAKEAEKNRIKALQIANGHPQVKYLIGLDYKNLLTRPEDAEWMLLKAIETNPNYINAINKLIELYQETGQFSKAKEWQQKLLEKAPDTFPEKYIDLDTFEFEQGEAKYYLENCVLLANYYEKVGEFERADFLYEKAIQLKPDTFTNEEAMSLAEAYLKLNTWEAAQKICPTEIVSEDANQNLAYGKLYYKLNQFEKAELHFQKYLQGSQIPRRAQNVGFFYYLNSDVKPTEKYLKKALEINPEGWGPYVGFSLLHFAYRDYEKAFQWIDESIQTFPDAVYLKSIRAFMIAYSDTPAGGMKAFEALEPLQPGSIKIGVCLKLMADGDYEAAEEVREEIIENLPPFVIPILDIGYVKMLTAKNDFSGAMEVIEENDWTGMFAFGILQYDPALAPLRETELYKKYIQRNFPGKLHR